MRLQLENMLVLTNSITYNVCVKYIAFAEELNFDKEDLVYFTQNAYRNGSIKD